VPLYEYRCDQCGPFDRRRGIDEANVAPPCPQCSEPARRVYTPPRIRARSGPLTGRSAADRARIDRALSGEPTVTSRPGGRPLPTRGHRH
jgi:putative FmdB family regulatory protein